MDCRRIYGCMSTYDMLFEKGMVLAEFVEEFVTRVVEPLHKKVTFFVDGEKTKSRELQFNKENWEKARQLFAEGKVAHFYLLRYEEEIRDSRLGISPVTIDLRIFSNYEMPVTASSIEFSVVKWLFEQGISSEVQQAYVEMLEKLHRSLKGVAGFITLDYLAASFSESPHESYMGWSYPWASRQFNRYYRGYLWGNFLTANHVEILGGPERVAKEAPVYSVKKLDDGGMYLQLTKDVNDFTDEDLRRLKNYFQPILMPRRHETDPRSYQGLRVITDE